MKDIDEALGRVAEAIRAHGAVPEDVIVGLECLRRSVHVWLAPGTSALVVPLHLRWLVAPSGMRLELRSRPTLRRLVAALVEGRIAQPGESLSSERLIAAGWPETPSVDEASINRLRVSLTRLRRAGLQEVLVTTDRGWMLKPSVPLTRGDHQSSSVRVQLASGS